MVRIHKKSLLLPVLQSFWMLSTYSNIFAEVYCSDRPCQGSFLRVQSPCKLRKLSVRMIMTRSGSHFALLFYKLDGSMCATNLKYSSAFGSFTLRKLAKSHMTTLGRFLSRWMSSSTWCLWFSSKVDPKFLKKPHQKLTYCNHWWRNWHNMLKFTAS